MKILCYARGYENLKLNKQGGWNKRGGGLENFEFLEENRTVFFLKQSFFE